MPVLAGGEVWFCWMGMAGRPVSLGGGLSTAGGVPRVGWTAVWVLGECGSESLPGLGDGGGPSPGGVDA